MSIINKTITSTNDSFYGNFDIKPTDLKIDYNHFFTPVAKSRINNYLRTMGEQLIRVFIYNKFIFSNFF